MFLLVSNMCILIVERGGSIMVVNLKERRKELNMTLEDVAQKVGVGKSTVRKWENGDIENIGRSNIVKLAEALKVTPYFVMGLQEDNKIDTYNIPVVSKISAGEPINAEENIESYIAIPNAKENTFGLIVSGDSMDKEFKDGDIVVVEKDAVVENGQIGVVHINGYNATVKRIKYNDDDIILIPESNNNEHVPKIFNCNDHIHIVGRVVGVYKQY